MSISIVIPNWNGKKLLEKNLPAVLAAKPEEIIIVDNASKDDSIVFLEKKYPGIRLIKNSCNLGFAVGCNQGVEASFGEFVVLLNSDVVPEKDFLLKSLPNFEDPQVFAVSFNEPQWSWARIYWLKGFIEHEPGSKSKKTHLSAWVNGGSGIFRKSIWSKLGGFDSIYHPFYWEDIDLSYRAWKRGYHVLWEPEAIVHHQHKSTIGKHFSDSYIRSISERNQLLFIWKNITSPKMMFEHKLNLIKRLFIHPGYWKPFGMAMLKWPQVMKRKLAQCRSNKISDNEIFLQFNSE